MSDVYKLMFTGGSTPADNEVSLGFLEKGSATIKGKETKTKFRKGNIVFPNRTEAWGRRLVRNSKGDDVALKERIDTNHKDYFGNIEWLNWGDKDGYPIETRYKAGCATLDYQYQVTRLGMMKREEEAEVEYNYLKYPSGYQEFDMVADKLLCEFLKIHFLNRDSKSKNPDSANGMYSFMEVKEFNTQEFETKEADLSFEAMKIVKEANTFDKLKILQVVLSRVSDISYDASKENSLYEALLLFAKNRAKEFFVGVDAYKSEVSKLIALTQAYNAFDTTLNGTIAVTLPTREVLIDEVPAKGDDMIQWLFDTCLEPRTFEVLEKLKLYSNKFKQ